MKEAIRKFKETVEIKSSLFKRLRSHRYFSAIVLTGLVIIVSCFHIWQRVKVYDLVMDVAILKKENKQLHNTLKKINSDISTLTLTARIEKYAKDTLGLKSITIDRLYTLEHKEYENSNQDEFDKMLSAIKRVSDFMPVITENEIRADELQIIKVDSSLAKRTDK